MCTYALPCSLRASSGGVRLMEQGCGARAQVSHTWTREAFWAPLRAPRQELADGQVAITSGVSEKRGPRTEIAAVERREARRSAHGPAISGEPEIGPTARRATRCGDPHQRRLGAPPPSRLVRGNYRKPRARMRRENAGAV